MSNGKLRSGQEYLARHDIIAPFTEQVVEYTNPPNPGTEKTTGVEGTTAAEIIPKDEGSATIRVYDKAAILAALEALVYSWYSKVSLSLPDVLTDLVVEWNTNAGNGQTLHPASQQSGEFVGSGEAHVTPRATAQGNVSLMPDLQATITSFREASRSVPATNFIFYAASPLTLTDIQIKLEELLDVVAVYDMPVFMPVSNVFTCMGQQSSVQAQADSSAVVAGSGSGASASESFSSEWGNGYSNDVGVSNRTVILPPTLHAGISLANATNTQSVTISVQANTVPLSIGMSVVVPAITNAPTPSVATASGEVTPASISATSPADIPRSGYYIADINVNLIDYGILMVHASVVDMSNFA